MSNLNDLARAAKERLQRKLRNTNPTSMNNAAARGSAVARHAMGTIFGKAFGSLFKGVSGLAGKIAEAVVGVGRRKAGGGSRQELSEAAEILEALGGTAIDGVDLSDDQEVIDAFLALEDEGIFDGPPQPPVIIKPGDDEWPEEHDIELLPRAEHPRLGEDSLTQKPITVDSSNVYSFAFQQTDRRYGILYVTFLAWAPGMKNRSGKGATYAYYDVPVSTYVSFKRAATKGSAGGAVWDYLRVRGSRYLHQHQYTLQSGAQVGGLVPGGVYVPRKNTPRGYRKRALAAPGSRAGRGFITSTLPEQLSQTRRPGLF